MRLPRVDRSRQENGTKERTGYETLSETVYRPHRPLRRRIPPRIRHEASPRGAHRRPSGCRRGLFPPDRSPLHVLSDLGDLGRAARPLDHPGPRRGQTDRRGSPHEAGPFRRAGSETPDAGRRALREFPPAAPLVDPPLRRRLPQLGRDRGRPRDPAPPRAASDRMRDRCHDRRRFPAHVRLPEPL